MKSVHIRSVACAIVGLLTVLHPDPGSSEGPRKLDTYKQAQTLGELADLVRRYYYERTDPVDLYHGAIEGYLSALDPHTTYITPEELKETQEKLQGSFEGIGIYFDIIIGT